MAYEHAETLLRSVFTFIGADVEFIVAEGLGRGEDARRTSIDGALERARGITREFTASATIGA